MTARGPGQSTVLLVERDAGSRDGFQRCLVDAGFAVRCFPDYLGALEEAESERRLDLLITGVRLRPGTPHGLSLAAMVRMRRPRLPILFIADDRSLAHVMDEGSIVLIKPIEASALIRTVTKLLRPAPRAWNLFKIP